MDVSTSKKLKTGVVVKRYVPPELIREISLYLPCKSLARFKSVSKLLYSFLDDRQFIDEHSKRNTKPSHYLSLDKTYQNDTTMHVFSLNSDEYSHVKTIATEKYRWILPSSYGLVCVHGFDSKNIALLNPVSGKLVPLPDLPRPPILLNSRMLSCNNVGFGFDLKCQKFKIVQLTIPLKGSQCFVLTVTSGTLSYREIDVPNKSLVMLFWGNSIYADGVLYWEMARIYNASIVKVFVFDLSTEKMGVIQSPVQHRHDRFGHGKHLTSLQGKLCCFTMFPPVDTILVMKIWKLHHCDFNGNQADWVLMYKLDIYNSTRLLYPLCIDDRDRLICKSRGDLYRYDIKSKSLEIYPVSQKFGGVGSYTFDCVSAIHSEAIIPINPIRL